MFLHMSVSYCVHMGGMRGPGDVPGGGGREHACPGEMRGQGPCMAGGIYGCGGMHGWGVGVAWPRVA